jgi:23S rRNA (guanosine2251-2'-O)-methyltransferase
LEVLRSSPQKIKELLLIQGIKPPEELRIAIQSSGIPPERIKSLTKVDFELEVGSAVHQGIAARLVPSSLLGLEEFLQAQVKDRACGILLVLDQISDPRNLGSILRVAEACAVDAVLLTRDHSAGLTPAARKASGGSSELLRLVSIGNLQRAIVRLKEAGYWIIGTEVHGDSANLYTADLPHPLALILGSEGSGLRKLTAKHCDMLVHLPIAGAIESLNVSQAAAVLLYELLRRREYTIDS